MGHSIPVPITKIHPIRNKEISADAHVTCFPTGRVEYKLDIIHVKPGEVFKITVQAMFKKGGKEKNLSRMATFYTNKSTVSGVSPGIVPYTGSCIPSDSAIWGVDDFEPTGGAHKLRHL